MTDKSQPSPQEVPKVFFDDVNSFISVANGIERRFDTHNAQLAMLHAFSHYCAHHYRSTVRVTADSPEMRQAFADHISGAVKQLVIEQLNMPLPTSAVPGFTGPVP